jgi:hypothetical protein
MARKAKISGFYVEAFNNGAWLWVITSPFKTEESAQDWIRNAIERHPSSEFRVIPAA